MIMGVFTVAAAILLFSTPVEAEAVIPPEEEDPSISSPLDDVDTELGMYADVPEDPEPDEPEVPTIIMQVETIKIMFDGVAKTDITESAGKKLQFYAQIEPVGIEEHVDIDWSTSNPDVFDYVPVPGGRVGGIEISFISKGDETLTLRVGDMETTCIIRVR